MPTYQNARDEPMQFSGDGVVPSFELEPGETIDLDDEVTDDWLRFLEPADGDVTPETVTPAAAPTDEPQE